MYHRDTWTFHRWCGRHCQPRRETGPVQTGTHPLLAAGPAPVSSTAPRSPEKLAFIISQLEKTFQQLLRSPPRVKGTSLLLLSLVVGSWGIFFPPPFV